MQKEMAYFLGLLVGGGKISNNQISVEFPYKDWSLKNFQISVDWYNNSVTTIAPMIKRILNSQVDVRYVPGSTPRFYINIDNVPTILYNTLTQYGIRPMGELRRHAAIQQLMNSIDNICKKSFIQGLADVIGSVRASHRRHSSISPTISFEIYGENWDLPFQLCQTLHDLGVPVNQILWHHPNMHAGSSPSAYWKKGHKVRIKAGDYAKIGFGMECKIKGLENLLTVEQQRRGSISHDGLCPDRRYSCSRCRKVRHRDEQSTELPPSVRGHFIHFTHICRALGCPHAPKDWLKTKIPIYMPTGTRQSTL